MSIVVLLGPQRYQPTLAAAFDRIRPEGAVAAVTAGWEDREDEIDELTEHLGREVVNLRLHRRTEQIFERDTEFFAAWQVRRHQLRRLRNLYRQRVGDQISSLRRLARDRQDELARDEWEDALRVLREMDDRHLRQVEALHAAFDAAQKPAERPAVALQRERVKELVDGCGSIALAGGHVAVLANRLRLFGIADLIGDRPLFAWSAGAMCATERVVIYHDATPQRAGDPLVLGAGLGLCPGIVALPHAHRRLRLDDPGRVSRFARRFAPYTCVALDDASGLIHDTGWDLFGDGARRLRTTGEVTEMQLVGGRA